MSGARLDKWLFHARFYRTRPLAQAAASAGKVRLNGSRIDKPGHAVKPNDGMRRVNSWQSVVLATCKASRNR